VRAAASAAACSPASRRTGTVSNGCGRMRIDVSGLLRSHAATRACRLSLGRGAGRAQSTCSRRRCYSRVHPGAGVCACRLTLRRARRVRAEYLFPEAMLLAGRPGAGGDLAALPAAALYDALHARCSSKSSRKARPYPTLLPRCQRAACQNLKPSNPAYTLRILGGPCAPAMDVLCQWTADLPCAHLTLRVPASPHTGYRAALGRHLHGCSWPSRGRHRALLGGWRAQTHAKPHMLCPLNTVVDHPAGRAP